MKRQRRRSTTEGKQAEIREKVKVRQQKGVRERESQTAAAEVRGNRGKG